MTFVYCIQTAENIVILLYRPGSAITLVFSPLQRGRKVHGLGKICDFQLKSPFISGTIRDRPMVAIER